VYVCAKCVGGGELAGLCLACSLHCHEGHQLYELYTKRWVNGGAVEEEEKQTWFTVYSLVVSGTSDVTVATASFQDLPALSAL